MGFNDGLNMARSYYARTAAPFAPRDRLIGEHEADLVVVGAGCTGLSAALHAARAGLSVAVLEGGRIGWGASGRNGGQIIPGLRKGAVELLALGPERARTVFHLALEARALVLDLIRERGIDCELSLKGHLLAGVRGSDLRRFEEEARCLAEVMDYPYAEVLGPEAMRARVDSPYHGGLFDAQGGHFHPLRYVQGLAEAAEADGARLYERSLALAVTQTAGRVGVTTDAGRVSARHAVLAGDALLYGLSRRIDSRIMPVANYLAATEPLSEAASLIPSGAAVSDTRFVVNYYRLTSDGRLLFGGGERYSPHPPRDISAFVRPYMEKVFPQVRGARIDFSWGGLVSVTTNRLPHVGREGEVLFAQGYSGMGAILSTLAGKLLCEEILGQGDRFCVFRDLEPPPFPGGGALRGPLHVLGMLWYALRDRIG